MKRLIFVVALFLLPIQTILFAQDEPYKVTQEYDEFENQTIIKLNPIVIYFHDIPRETLYLTFTKIENDDSTFSTILKITYIASDWIFIEQENALKLLVDGKKLEPNEIFNKRDARQSYVIEIAAFNLPEWDLSRMANASEIKFKLIADRKVIKSALFPGAVKNIGRFYNEYYLGKKKGIQK